MLVAVGVDVALGRGEFVGGGLLVTAGGSAGLDTSAMLATIATRISWVGVADGIGRGVLVAVGVDVALGRGVTVRVGVALGSGVELGLRVGVGVSDGAVVGVAVGLEVADGDGV